MRVDFIVIVSSYFCIGMDPFELDDKVSGKDGNVGRVVFADEKKHLTRFRSRDCWFS